MRTCDIYHRFGLERLEQRRLMAAGPSISVGDAVVTEGNSGAQNAVVTVSLSAASSKSVSVSFRTEDGTASAGSDYQAVASKLTFAPGERTKTVAVPVFGDRAAEPDEVFSVKLSGAKNANISDGQGLVKIVDDEPRLAINDVSLLEGDSGETFFAFTVSLSTASDTPIAVDFATADSTATTADNDYLAASGTLAFAAGETIKTITVRARGDATGEWDEAFSLNLSGAVNAFIADGQGLGWIVNDDPFDPPHESEPCTENCGVDGEAGWPGVAP